MYWCCKHNKNRETNKWCCEFTFLCLLVRLAIFYKYSILCACAANIPFILAVPVILVLPAFRTSHSQLSGRSIVPIVRVIPAYVVPVITAIPGQYNIAFILYMRMRSSLVFRASDCQCTSCNGPGFDPSIRRHSDFWGAADEAVLNTVRKKSPPPKK